MSAPRRATWFACGEPTQQGHFKSGGYQLEAQYVDHQAQLEKFVAETLSSARPQSEQSVHVNETTLAHFVLTVDPVKTAASVALWAVIYDAAGSVVGRFAAHAGESRSSGTLLLAPGDYRLELTAARPDGGLLPEVGFQLLGKTISLPIGPGISDPTRAPMLPRPNLGGGQAINSHPVWRLPIRSFFRDRSTCRVRLSRSLSVRRGPTRVGGTGAAARWRGIWAAGSRNLDSACERRRGTRVKPQKLPVVVLQYRVRAKHGRPLPFPPGSNASSCPLAGRVAGSEVAAINTNHQVVAAGHLATTAAMYHLCQSCLASRVTECGVSGTVFYQDDNMWTAGALTRRNPK